LTGAGAAPSRKSVLLLKLQRSWNSVTILDSNSESVTRVYHKATHRSHGASRNRARTTVKRQLQLRLEKSRHNRYPGIATGCKVGWGGWRKTRGAHASTYPAQICLVRRSTACYAPAQHRDPTPTGTFHT